MGALFDFVQSHRSYFDVAQAVSAVVSLFAWTLAAILLVSALCRRRVDSLSVGPFSFRMKQDALEATATAARSWNSPGPDQTVDVSRIRETVEWAFAPQTSDNLIGKSILWVDDHPANNRLAERALKKFNLEVEQATSTEGSLDLLRQRRFDLIISDQGRGDDLQAGYGLLRSLRDAGNDIPFFIFSSLDKPEFRREAKERGAQLSTNDMLELVDNVIKILGSRS